MGSGKVSPGAAAGGSGSPPQQPPGAAVCCMCGDRGLVPELFRCSACAVRSQHTYCTDRYPKVESYGTCNWCLRADGGVASTSSSSPRSAGKAAARVAAHHGETIAGGSRPPKVAARGDFASSNLSKPIKKQPQQQRLLLRRSASDLGVSRVRDAPPPSPSGAVARGRPRVRRYKLLEEVITS
ncbi:unnamed protein product [Urochloa humidicola]